jgi:hypothetical protein
MDDGLSLWRKLLDLQQMQNAGLSAGVAASPGTAHIPEQACSLHLSDALVPIKMLAAAGAASQATALAARPCSTLIT